MRIYYYDNSYMVDQMPGYEGVTTLESVPIDSHASKLR